MVIEVPLRMIIVVGRRVLELIVMTFVTARMKVVVASIVPIIVGLVPAPAAAVACAVRVASAPVIRAMAMVSSMRPSNVDMHAAYAQVNALSLRILTA